MYIPKLHEEPDLSVLQALINAHPLGTWVTQGDGELIANHIPFLLDPSRGKFGTLAGHVARANPVWQSFSKSIPSIVAFQGAQSYITPSWYETKREHGKVVPTWNYAVVHAHGIPCAWHDGDWLLEHVGRLTNTHESGQSQPWKVSDAPAEFVEKLLQAIVGIEIPIDTLNGKWKVSQNRNEVDKRGIVTGLLQKSDSQADLMANYVKRFMVESPEGD